MDPFSTWLILGLGMVIGASAKTSFDLAQRERRRRAIDAYWLAPVDARLATRRALNGKPPAGSRPTRGNTPRPAA